MDIDVSELRTLEQDLGRTPGRMVPVVDAVLKRGAQNVKDDLVEDANRSRWFRQIAPTISYDRAAFVGGIAYEIGPDRHRGGAAKLANIAYFGGARGGGGTLDIDGPFEREEPRTLAALAREVGDLL